MAVNTNWPLVVDQIAFTGDPNDPNSTPTYTDLTARVRSFEASRGRQYEIDQNQTGEAHLVVSDSDEVLNPANTSAPAPFNGNIKPYRRYLRQAMWPPAPVGGAVNLLNANAVPVGYDPDFENTAVGATPPNLLTFNTSPTVQAANPFTGTKSLQWSVAGNSSEQVTGFTIPTIPGRQYTASVYYRQTAANTGVLFVNGGPGSTTTTATGTYVRLTVTFTATQPTHQLFVGSFSPTLASTVNIDAIQLEPSPAPLNANPYFETDASGWSAQGGSIARSTAHAHEGSASLLLTPNGTSATAEADGNAVPITASNPYTASAWVYCAVARNVFVTINWFDGSGAYLSTAASTTTAVAAGTWTQIVCTATAPATAGKASPIIGMSSTPPTSNLLWIDEATLSGPSAFTTSGPTIYTPFAGYVERWPSSWNHQGTYGMCTMTCVDAMAVLAGTDMHAELRGANLAKNPDYYWTLGEPSGAITFGETSGHNGPPMQQLRAATGLLPGSGGSADTSFSAGTATNVAGDPGGTGVAISAALGTNVTLSSWCVAQAGNVTGKSAFNLPSGQSYTIAFWMAHSIDTQNVIHYWMGLISDYDVANSNNSAFSYTTGIYAYPPGFSGAGSPAQIKATITWPGAAGSYDTLTVNDTYGDGKPHLYVMTSTLNPPNAVTRLYIDGVQVASSSYGSASLSTPWHTQYLDMGGIIYPYGNNGEVGPLNGVYSHVALWNRELSASEVTDLWNAGQGYPGETSGQRIARLLSIGGYTGPTTIDTGQSTMGVSTVTEGAALLDACQQVTLSENGNLYVEAGTVTAKARTDRYLKTTAKWVFGENQAGGEYPYEADIAYDYDPTRVVNDVTVTRVGGIKANATDATSQKQYFRRSYQRTIGVQSDLETIDAANYLLGQGKQPIQRVSRLSIKPSANPALWPVALGARIGDRVTVKRRTSAGLTMSSDYFIEKVDHTNEPGSWVTTFQMSPVGRYQVGIFDDATYGRFDSTLVFGY